MYRHDVYVNLTALQGRGSCLDCGGGRGVESAAPLQPELGGAGEEEHSVLGAPGPLPHSGTEHSRALSLLLPSPWSHKLKDEVRTTGLHVGDLGRETISLPRFAT